MSDRVVEQAQSPASRLSTEYRDGIKRYSLCDYRSCLTFSPSCNAQHDSLHPHNGTTWEDNGVTESTERLFRCGEPINHRGVQNVRGCIDNIQPEHASPDWLPLVRWVAAGSKLGT